MREPSIRDNHPGRRTARPASGRPPRSRLFYLGAVFVLAGTGMLGYVAWQFLGTNVVSRHESTQLRKDTENAWASGKAGPSQALLRVPRFGKDYSIPVVQGFSRDALSHGVGRYPDGAAAGALGNFVLAGHRVTHGQPFRDFPDLRKGDLVKVETRTATYTYRLRNGGSDIVVDFSTAWPLWPVPSPEARGAAPTEHLITLLTCSELFHTDDRSVVVGELVRSTPVRR